MKKFVVALALVLALSSVAMAADVKLSGDVRFNLVKPSEENGGSGDFTAETEYRLGITATVDENTSAYVYGKAVGAAAPFATALYYAEVNTKLAGNTLRFGRVEYGSSPFTFFGDVVSARDGAVGMALASADFNGLALSGFMAPAGDKWNFAGEATYKVLDGSVGFAIDKAGADDKSGYSLFGSYPVVPDVATVYAEIGKDASENDVQSLGVSGKLSAISYVAETNLEAKKTVLQGSYTLNGVVYTVNYQFGDGYTDPGADGKLNIQAKIKF